MAITVMANTFAKVRIIFDNTKSIAAMMGAVHSLPMPQRKRLAYVIPHVAA